MILAERLGLFAQALIAADGPFSAAELGLDLAGIELRELLRGATDSQRERSRP